MAKENASKPIEPATDPAVNSKNAVRRANPFLPSVLRYNDKGVPVGADASTAPREADISDTIPITNMMNWDKNSEK